MEPEEKQRLAKKVKSTKNYLSQIAHGHRSAGKAIMRKLIKADPRLHAEMFL